MHFGIDYGSKLAGTTVITYDHKGQLHQVSSAKKQDADAMILAVATELEPTSIYLDGPLSLPGAYSGNTTDYHYRKADRELGAMSPMFLGGLTARAMSLAAQLRDLGVLVFETYPGAYVRSQPALAAVYKKRDTSCIPACLEVLSPHLDLPYPTPVDTLHQLDSIIAWHSGQRHTSGVATVVGDESEGVIIY